MGFGLARVVREKRILDQDPTGCGARPGMPTGGGEPLSRKTGIGKNWQAEGRKGQAMNGDLFGGAGLVFAKGRDCPWHRRFATTLQPVIVGTPNQPFGAATDRQLCNPDGG